ncbi:MAG TPA: PEPxxWA-CTERM sorting domain-containing protein [Caulobacteraceae bacterium]|nr:PEPxxWA-CTERM sorting domain-containing protein [Caulobacteraceae bacterium]
MKWALTGAAAAAAMVTMGVSGPASATTTLYITNVTVQSFNTLLVNGSSTIASAIGLTIKGDPHTLWVWCVDLDHTIGIGSYNPPLPYEISPVTTDSTGATSGTGNPLSLMVSEEIATLATIGTNNADSATPNALDLTAIQGAIWQIEYPGDTVTGTPAENALIATYIADAMAHPSAGYDPGFYPVGPNGQGFGSSQGFGGGVPEPAPWAMMLLGFAGLGALARRQRLGTTA